MNWLSIPSEATGHPTHPGKNLWTWVGFKVKCLAPHHLGYQATNLVKFLQVSCISTDILQNHYIIIITELL